jgi:hypothetical protein
MTTILGIHFFTRNWSIIKAMLVVYMIHGHQEEVRLIKPYIKPTCNFLVM